MSDEARAAHIARTPLGRVGTPADIASVAVFLASDEARWMTGECLAVSGGLRQTASHLTAIAATQAQSTVRDSTLDRQRRFAEVERLPSKVSFRTCVL
jgi:hypothetical protein